MKHFRFYQICIYLLFFMLITNISVAENIQWNFFETENFKIIYHPEVEMQALHAAKIAEEVFIDLCIFTGFKPYRKIAIVISAYDDFGNGAAIPRDLIYIWANPLYTLTRVDGKWLENVITHELTHILQMEATFGSTYKIHKITGTSSIFTVPPNTLQPRWFLEGVAQYGAMRWGYDSLDRKRQMIMEQKAYNPDFYTEKELYWDRSTIGGESAYNFGFGFISYLMKTYGEYKLLEIQKLQNDYYFLGLNSIMKMVYGKTLEELITEWNNDLKNRYSIRKERECTIPIVTNKSLIEYSQPIITPDKGIIFVAKSFENPTVSIKYWHPHTGLKTLLCSPLLALTNLSLSKDGSKLLYTAYNYYGQHLRSDLYELNLIDNKKTRITKNQRILMGVHFKNSYIVLRNDWGKHHLYLLEDGKYTKLTDTDFNFFITNFTVSPDNTKLAINFNYEGRRGIGIMSTESWIFEHIYFPGEGRDWLLGDFIDNRTITLSWDRLNHYDLYKFNIESGLIERITNTKEDILKGFVRDLLDTKYWYGLVFNSTGFSIAGGTVKSYETLELKPENITFTQTKKPPVKKVKSGKYNHLEQLRKDFFSPTINTSDDNLVLGLTHLLSDPLQELSIYYDLNWNLKHKKFQLNFQTNWLGSNPGILLYIQNDGSAIIASLQEIYQYYPLYVSLAQTIKYNKGFTIDRLQLSLAKATPSVSPSTSSLEINYFPASLTGEDGYSVKFEHNQTFYIGNKGDIILTNTQLGYAGGKTKFAWGNDMFWVYPDEYFAEGMLYQKISYKKPLIDLSYSLTNILQTGRIYGNLLGELGGFYSGGKLILANMLVCGLELETQIFNLLPINHQILMGINSNKNIQIRYEINTPF